MVAQTCNPNAGEVETKGFLGPDDHQPRVFGGFPRKFLERPCLKKDKVDSSEE